MSRRAVVQGLAAAVAVAGLATWAVATASPPKEGGRGHAVEAAATHLPLVAAVAQPSGPPPSWIATLRAATPYSATPGGPAVGTLPATNPFAGAEVLAVVGTPGPVGWARVELPVRPNGSTAWIRTAAVSLSTTTYRVVVSTEAHTVAIYDGARLLLATPAAVGKPSTPTPKGPTYLWELIRPDNPNGAYGPYIFGLAWFSDAYSVFNGGDAQIGLHGQDEPWSIGHPVSHGCVRVGNDVITHLAGLLPLGTPVAIL